MAAILCLILSLRLMKAMFRSTSDSLSPQPKRAHNCPFCRCSFSTRTLASSNNLYLNDHMFMTFNATCKQSACRGSQRLSITFSYSNPLKMQKRSSADAKFSTKKYKESRFPHLGTRELQEDAVFQIVKSKKGHTFINSAENTPPKHQLLKNNKTKNREKLGITSKQSLVESQSQRIPSEMEAKNEIVPKQTPINYLKYETSSMNLNANGLAQNAVKKSQIRLDGIKAEADNYPATLLTKMVEQTESKMAPKILKNFAGNYATFQSIAVFKTDPKAQKSTQEQTGKADGENLEHLENLEQGQKAMSAQENEQASETSLRIEEKAGGLRWRREVLLCESDRQLAQEMSQELLLNYDYFLVLPESDRSLSACLTL